MITRFAVENRTVTYFTVFLLVAGGIGSYFSLGQLEDPEFTVKTARIATASPGSSTRAAAGAAEASEGAKTNTASTPSATAYATQRAYPVSRALRDARVAGVAKRCRVAVSILGLVAAARGGERCR